jgi:phthalate 4,5-cis-dihydrodiol dehydrogenase
LLGFEDGAFASLTYSGYAFYDTDTLMDGVGELGRPKAAGAHADTRARWQSRVDAAGDEAAEARAKAERNFGGLDYKPEPKVAPSACQHFGPVIVSCDRGDLRLQPDGVDVIDRHGVRRVAAPVPEVPRAEVVDELWAVLRDGEPARHDGRWSRGTLAVCLAMLDSHRLAGDVEPDHQVAWLPSSRRR